MPTSAMTPTSMLHHPADDVDLVLEPKRQRAAATGTSKALSRARSRSSLLVEEPLQNSLESVLRASGQSGGQQHADIIRFMYTEHTRRKRRKETTARGFVAKAPLRSLTVGSVLAKAHKTAAVHDISSSSISGSYRPACEPGRRASYSEHGVTMSLASVPPPATTTAGRRAGHDRSNTFTHEKLQQSVVAPFMAPMALALLKDRSLHWDFDVFGFSELCGGQCLTPLFAHLVADHFVLAEHFSIPFQTLMNFVHSVELLYLDNRYHNNIHAADVLHNMAFFLQSESLRSVLSPADALAALVAAAIHDVSHPGLTNSFLIETQSPLALCYNDKHVLENYHCAQGFRVLRKEGHNIFASLPKEQYREVRETIIELVLATDMQWHSDHVSNLQRCLAKKRDKMEWFTVDCVQDRRMLLRVALHTADLANPAKPRTLAIEWAERLSEESFVQGDKERELGLPISPLMDRRATDRLAESQLAFMSLIVRPLWLTFSTIVPEARVGLWHMDANRALWQSRIQQRGSGEERGPTKTASTGADDISSLLETT